MKTIRYLRTFLALALLAAIALSLGSYSLFAQDNRPQIRLHAATFDPSIGEPAIAAQNRATLTAGTESTYLVQFVGPVREDWKKAVQQLGARLYRSIPDHAFLTRMDSETARQVEALDEVNWVGPYHPAYRVAPELTNAGASLQASASITVTITTLPDIDLDARAADIAALNGTVLGQDANFFAGYLDALVPPASINDIARLDGVVWIAPKMPLEYFNDVGGGSVMNVDDVREQLGLYGEGQIVGVADSGLDTGNLSTLHPDVAGRVIATQCIGRPDPCDWSDPGGHGTHVVGSVLGNGIVSGSDPATNSYSGSYAGNAPKAELVMQSLDNLVGRLAVPTESGDLMTDAYAEGARIHTNSWGGPTGQDANGNPTYGAYAILNEQFDTVMWQNPDLLVLAAAGNDGIDFDGDGVVDLGQIGQPSGAKNILTVGASENNRPSINFAWGPPYGEPIATDLRSDNIDGMAAFSSRGPTNDGRIKPEVAAPGTFIASLRSRQYVFDDDLEGTTGSYTNINIPDGATSAWTVVSNARSGTSALNQTLNGTFPAGAGTAILTPPFNATAAGAAFDLNMWHTYSLAGDDTLGVALVGPDTSNPTQNRIVTFNFNFSGEQSTYAPVRTTFGIGDVIGYGIDPTQLQIGFFVTSADTTFASSWTIDDIRIDNNEWVNMYQVGLAEAGDSIDEAYAMQGGTSMATPLTAGAAALVREWLVGQGETAPSGALMKAILVNGAVDMRPGQYGTGTQQEIPETVPNNVSGWGRVDVLNSLSPAAPRQVWYTDEKTGLATGGVETYSLTVNDADGTSTDALRISLVWTDYPGSAEATKALVNDLDLEVTAPDGTTFYGNQGLYTSGQCLRGSADACNPVETVMLPSAAVGTYNVTVRAYEVAQGGQQPFAVVAAGKFGDDPGPDPDPDPQLGDCNADSIVNASDITATILRVFGLDYLTTPTCDSNEDSTVNAADVSCTVLLAFGQSCGSTPDPDPDPDPEASQELISNGSFEEDGSWFGTQNGVVITNTQSYDGSYSLYFVEGMDNNVYQSVTFPSNPVSATLTFYWKTINPDAGYDSLLAVLCEPSDTCTTNYGTSAVLEDSGGTWVQEQITVSQSNLTTLAGQTIDLVFFKDQDDIAPEAGFYIDNVSLEVTTSTNLNSASAAAPVLSIGSAAPTVGRVTLPVSLSSGDAAVSSVAFSIDYDETQLAFDPTDADGDGTPDALRLATPDGFTLSTTFDASDTDGEIDIFVGDLSPALDELPDGTLLFLTLDLVGQPDDTAAVRIAADPAVSFGTPQGVSVAGSGTDGTVQPGTTGPALYLPLVQR